MIGLYSVDVSKRDKNSMAMCAIHRVCSTTGAETLLARTETVDVKSAVREAIRIVRRARREGTLGRLA